MQYGTPPCKKGAARMDNAMNRFLAKLEATAQRNHSLLCVGLDPSPAQMPVSDIAEFNRGIIEATQDLVCAFKPQMAFYEAQGLPGLKALEQTLAAIPGHIPVILDAKRGDIASTAQAYAKAMFEVWGVDAVTVNPYMGGDSLEPFLAYEDRGVLVLTRTSNQGGADFQDLQVAPGDGATMPLYQYVAHQALRWNAKGNVGLIAGATYPQELGELRSICPEMPILVPGIGPQEGALEASVRSGVDSNGRHAIISSSRQVIYASQGTDYPEAARRTADTLRGQINATLEAMGHPW